MKALATISAPQAASLAALGSGWERLAGPDGGMHKTETPASEENGLLLGVVEGTDAVRQLYAVAAECAQRSAAAALDVTCT